MARTHAVLMFAVAIMISLPFVGGCTSKTTVPHIGFGSFDMKAQLSRDDIVVLERVEGTSRTTNICFGLIQVIDNDKLKILGIPFFKDRYTFVRDELGIMGCFSVSTEDRAYYKALEATPEADAVFYRRMSRESTGIPLFWETKTVTFSGKAITLKTDMEFAKL